MKLIIQIPCYNEEQALPVALSDLPRAVEGIDRLEILVIDDGSDDRTAEIARGLGVNHVLRFKAHRGLAAAFSAGLMESLRLGADVIVNTDADNQYRASDIPGLVRPILEGRADVVVGDRQNARNRDFSFVKRLLQKYGSRLVSFLSGVRVPDTTSGFRAFSREAALRMNILTDYSYTLESLIQLGHMKFKILSVPVGTNRPLRRSKLMKNSWAYLASQAGTIIRVHTIYRPLRTFFGLGLFLAFPGALALARYVFHAASGRGSEHTHGLILAIVLLATAIMISVLGLVADIAGGHRKLTEDALTRIKRIELEGGVGGARRDRPDEGPPC
jgi:glycosyltransferase involved in cell wall biosynthesis